VSGTGPFAPRRSVTGRVLLAVIGFYSRAISPALPARCRFLPTCSAYAAEAISRHGAARGSWLAVRRLAKCAPWHPGGYDPVPDPMTGTHASHASHPEATPPVPRAANEESSVA
jgi:putative membrane protein insertion efficiency factor